MRSSMAWLAPRFSSVRMLQEYVERGYVPGAASYKRRAAGRAAVARSLEQWSRHLEQHWAGIRFGEVTATGGGGRLTVSVPVCPRGDRRPDDVRVELYADAGGRGRGVRTGDEADRSRSPGRPTPSSTARRSRPTGRPGTSRLASCRTTRTPASRSRCRSSSGRADRPAYCCPPGRMLEDDELLPVVAVCVAVDAVVRLAPPLPLTGASCTVSKSTCDRL